MALCVQHEHDLPEHTTLRPIYAVEPKFGQRTGSSAKADSFASPYFSILTHDFASGPADSGRPP